FIKNLTSALMKILSLISRNRYIYRLCTVLLTALFFIGCENENINDSIGIDIDAKEVHPSELSVKKLDAEAIKDNAELFKQIRDLIEEGYSIDYSSATAIIDLNTGSQSYTFYISSDDPEIV